MDSETQRLVPGVRTLRDARTARTYLERMVAGTLPIRSWMLARLSDLPARRVPLLLVDVQQRTDLLEIADWHRAADDAYVRTQWEVLPALAAAVLTVELEAPTPGRFTLAFNFDSHEGLLATLIDTGILCLVLGSHRDSLTPVRAQDALVMPCVREPVASIFAVWRFARLLHAEGRN